MDHKAYRQLLRERVGLRDLPFDESEYRGRHEALAARLAESGLDALLITDAADICYLTGYNTFEVSVHTALLAAADRLVLQVPSIETGPAVTGSRVDEVMGYRWEGAAGAVAQLAGAIGDLGAGDGAIGVDDWSAGLRPALRQGLQEALPRARLVDASGLVDGLRIIKSPAELAYLGESARLTRAGIDAAAATVRPGVSDQTIAAAAAEAMLAGGSEFMSMQPIVTAGWRSSVIHTNHRRHEVAAGDPVFLELGACWQRYTAPLMHTVIAGTPTADMVAIHRRCRAVYEAVTAAMRPGESFDQAAAAAEAALEPDAHRVFFSGVFGYTVGVQFPPSWVEGSGFIARGETRTFEENMVFHLPLCLRLPGAWGIGVSETVRVTPNGAEPITNNDWTLRKR
ncbi:aminopeptidase P family protein [Spiribacter halobius]|uniref:Aminopeptidase P family protein n=2 Tax=Sediminicurvatus halobius TaxID=2182432 RepID=A0A2U2MXY8_9GAMM|nr:Xaa-Pro peptidase family protein [Spiribacter halobius]PWG61544.1 aminopeptidase P family protein [Spiribacter halobius]UEX77112.1 Xaa-Pro peptidase family protein [Spiribacter halobius]